MIVVSTGLLAALICVVPGLTPDTALADAAIAGAERDVKIERARSFGLIVVRVGDETADALLDRGFTAHPDVAQSAPPRTGFESLDLLLKSTRALELRAAFDLSVNAEAKRAQGLHQYFTIRFAEAPKRRIEGLRLLYQRHNLIEQAESARIARVLSAPNDELFDEQWAHGNGREMIKTADGRKVGNPDWDLATTDAWERGAGDSLVTIAFLDTGIDLEHPEFAGRILPGYDFVNDDDDPTDDHGHGTACAGIAAAEGNNGIGIAGIAWGCRILPIKVLNRNGFGAWPWVAGGLVMAADRGAQVVCMSLGGERSMLMEAAVDYAWSQNCAMFAPSGNGNEWTLTFPARYVRVTAVGALSPCGDRKSPHTCDAEDWWGSNFGPGIDFLAPGVHIVTTDLTGRAGYTGGDYFKAFNGTSAAAAHAAGVAALISSRSSELTNASVIERMKMSCEDLSSPGIDVVSGYGFLNAERATDFVDYDPVEQTWEEEHSPFEAAAAGTRDLWDGMDSQKRRIGVSCFLAVVIGTLFALVRRRAVVEMA
jgi:subtilisin family serine protease